MWTYLTQPFTFALPGFQTSELEPWDEAGQRWRRLRVAWPSYLATHSTEQTLYFGEDGLLARHDYEVEISRRHERGALPLRLRRCRGHQDPHQTQDLPARSGRPVSHRAPRRLNRSQRDRVHATACRRRIGEGAVMSNRSVAVGANDSAHRKSFRPGPHGVLRLIGRVQSECLEEIEAQMEGARSRLALDLEEVTLVDVAAVRFLTIASAPGSSCCTARRTFDSGWGVNAPRRGMPRRPRRSERGHEKHGKQLEGERHTHQVLAVFRGCFRVFRASVVQPITTEPTPASPLRVLVPAAEPEAGLVAARAARDRATGTCSRPSPRPRWYAE